MGSYSSIKPINMYSTKADQKVKRRSLAIWDALKASNQEKQQMADSYLAYTGEKDTLVDYNFVPQGGIQKGGYP